MRRLQVALRDWRGGILVIAAAVVPLMVIVTAGSLVTSRQSARTELAVLVGSAYERAVDCLT
jgi:hypothetical protein